MQQAPNQPVQAQPDSPGEGWIWSARLKRWCEPGASPQTGVVPPAHARFKPGVSDPRQSQGGIYSARVRELSMQDDRIVDRIARRWIRNAERGDNRALAMLLDRLEGPIVQQVQASIESRYVIEEAGCAYVDAAPALTVAASDNMHYVSGCTDESGRAPMEGEPKSGGGGADPDGGIASPTAEHVHVWKVMHPETGQSSCTVAGCEYMFIPSVPLCSLPPAKILGSGE